MNAANIIIPMIVQFISMILFVFLLVNVLLIVVYDGSGRSVCCVRQRVLDNFCVELQETVERV